jgi:molybdopterin-guanine dinucleotide biosynthesis protein A
MNSKSHKRRKPLPFQFNHYEIAFSGYSNSGKTTLIEKIINKFSDEYSVGYVKHDAHFFAMDVEGKDTYKMTQAGASNCYINDSTHNALQSSIPSSQNLQYQKFLDNDFVLVEGFKSSDIPKFIIADGEATILDQEELFNDKTIGIIGQSKSNPSSMDFPYFHRDDITSIAAAVLNHFHAKTEANPIYGLVLGGGHSTRMGVDKNHIEFKGDTLSNNAYRNLSTVCSKVFHSSRAGQIINIDHHHIDDSFLDLGPLGGILSAQRAHPEATWLVVACDLPRIDQSVLEHLIKSRAPFKMATAFASEYSKHPEPLCTLFEPKSYTRNLQVMARGFACPRNCLIESQIKVVAPLFKGSLDNANTSDDLKRIIEEASNN